jgi:hypothetical protein
MAIRKTNKFSRKNGNGSTARGDLHEAEGTLWRASCVIETTHKALSQADETNDGEGVTRAINALRVGLNMLDEVRDELEQLGIRLFHEGCPAEDVKKLKRENTSPVIRMLRSSRSPAQKVKALQKVMGVRPS